MVRDQRTGPLTTPLNVAESRAHLAQAHEYLRAAEHSLQIGDWNASGGNAVLAAMNAADAVAGFILGSRWSGVHEQAANHVAKAGDDGKAVASQLRKLVRKKNLSHYEAKPLTGKDARDMVQSASRATATADRAAARIPSH